MRRISKHPIDGRRGLGGPIRIGDLDQKPLRRASVGDALGIE